MSTFNAQRNNRASIAATATAVPPYAMRREEVKAYMKKVFSFEGRKLEAALTLVDNSSINQRYSVFPLDYIIQPRSLTQINREYQEQALILCRKVISDCLTQTRIDPAEIDYIIIVSCTGVMIPSLDAHLINELGFRPNVRRLPITELGCAAGAAALSRAREFICGFPEMNVLVVAVELPSLTFQRGDLSQANLVSCTLFGDGAAAVLVTGRDTTGPLILDTDSYLFPSSIDAMGFDLRETGFYILLSKEVPQLIRDRIGELIDAFLKRNGLRRDQLACFILHPGGKKLLSYMEEELGLSHEDVQPSWDVLCEYGNLSSATILFVLQEWLSKRPVASNNYGLMAAFGPGFSSELLLLKWV